MIGLEEFSNSPSVNVVMFWVVIGLDCQGTPIYSVAVYSVCPLAGVAYCIGGV